MTDSSEYDIVREALPPRSEYRFELEAGQRQAIRLVPGTGDAEIFGAELFAKDQGGWYVFGDEVKACVCTWNGCEIELCPPPTAAYLSSESSPTFTSYTNLHLHQEKARLNARAQIRDSPSLVYDLRQSSEAEASRSTDLYRPEGQGPRILLLGPEASGKSSLTKFLCNYAMRSPVVTSTGHEEQDLQQQPKEGEVQGSEPTGWWPVLVNLDPAVGAPPLPCTISAHPLSPLPQSTLTSATPLLPYGLTTPVSGSLPPTASTASSSSSISMWLGRESYKENDAHAQAIIHSLARQVEKRMCRDMKARMSGMVIDTWGTTSADSKSKYALVKEVVKAFHIDTILVMGQEKVTVDLTRIFASAQDCSPRPTVVKMPKSGGAVEEDDAYQTRLRSAQIKTYFYGGSAGPSSTKTSGAGDHAAALVDGASADKAVKVPGGDEPLGGLGHLNPYSQTIPLDLLEIYRVGQDSMAPSSALPIGASRALSASTLHQLDPINSAADQSSLTGCILALVDAPGGGGGKGQKDSEVWRAELGDEEGERQVAESNIRGYIHVQSIDVARKRMTVLAPAVGRLPSKTALIGTLDWQDA